MALSTADRMMNHSATMSASGPMMSNMPHRVARWTR